MRPSMNWSNGFSTTLTLKAEAFGRRRCYAARRSPAGRWQLRVDGATWLRAELCAAWLAGPLAGLAFRGGDGARYNALVWSAAQSTDDWRRLRVHLKLPPT